MVDIFAGDTVHYLVGVGAPLDATDEQGQSALHFSCLGGHAEVTSYLINEGSDLEVTPSLVAMLDAP